MALSPMYITSINDEDEVWSYQDGVRKQKRFHLHKGILTASGPPQFCLCRLVCGAVANSRNVLAEPVIVPHQAFQETS